MTRRFLSLLVVCFFVFNALNSTAQSGPVTADEAREQRLDSDRLVNGYKTSIPGWVIKVGDTLYFGKASQPNKQFGFVYETPSTYVNGRLVYRYLPSDYAGKRGIVKDLIQNGTKRQGFKMCAEIGVGMLVRYYAELDNAIEAGEVLPPPSHRTTASSAKTATGSVSVADEILKLKQLMDAGALSKEEFEAQKKKLLNN
ncbi:SHOCT domain-containing protein [Spirosoma sp. BT702]|uniref:SHOCT domain-containing protein n=1 Tax=Spirosoma profusum TaxID=2771354 RepID=A0A927APF0_9BACT|nr:SHOCT domain-containing protein [Spirosoma profusum]MBD2704309.1 SHOCT domain-containing protein [Spirosoma profusum]